MLKYYYSIQSIHPITGESISQKIIDAFNNLGDGFGTPKIKFNQSALWADVAQLKWALFSDRIITSLEIKTRLNELDYNYKLDSIKVAIVNLRTAFVEMYPFLNRIDNSILTQIIALGHEICTAVGTIPNFIDFIKSECQSINLYEILESHKPIINVPKK